MNIGKNGCIKLPPGFRFHPTDEELIHQYLVPKVLNHPLPANFIPHFDVCRSDPWDLPGDRGGKERYFFSTREVKYPNGNRANRATSSGYWKATGKDKPVVVAKNKLNTSLNIVIGMKKTLVFYKGKPPHGSRTDWIMHEYRLVQKTSDWVLCRIFLKKRNNNGNSKNALEEDQHQHQQADYHDQDKGTNVIYYDFMARDRSRRIDLNAYSGLSSSSGSSVVTEMSTNGDGNTDHNEVRSVEERDEDSSSVSSSLSLKSL